MRKFISTISVLFLFVFAAFGQISPVKAYGELFKEVQINHVFPDSKTFPDCIPVKTPADIMVDYHRLKNQKNFDLKTFVLRNFLLPPQYDVSFKTNPSNTIIQHIEILWKVLERKPDTLKNTSLIPLPYPYIVPGGRFREIYYWDSYFTMLGLLESGKKELAESMIKNFAYLIDQYGFIPNGNRTYYLSRSQPPFFSLMLTLTDEENLEQYLPELEKEYQFWMQGAEELKTKDQILRVVRMQDGEILNRYYDNQPAPRPESYVEDLQLAKNSGRPEKEVYLNVRAACESGWDFSSRWLKDPENLTSIQTTSIVPVDLNCLLYHLEKTLAKGYRIAGDPVQADRMKKAAIARKEAILKYCWSEQDHFFMDFNLQAQQSSKILSLAGIFPLFFEIATPSMADSLTHSFVNSFLKKGGAVTSPYTSGQQWDAPNGWAPLEYICVKGFEKYDKQKLAGDVKDRWLAVNREIFRETGSMMEKYDVVNPVKEAGGGEYPGQDGFGWTNGVYLKLNAE